MALSAPTHLTYASRQDAGGSSSTLVTPSVSPASDCLLIVAGLVDTDGGFVNTITGVTTTLSNVGAWTIVQEIGTATVDQWFICYAKVTGAPGSGTITVTTGPSTADAFVCEVLTVTGHDLTTPVAQSNTAHGTGATASATLGASPAATSMVFGLTGRFTSVNSAATMTPGAGFTESGQSLLWNSSWNFGLEIETQYKLGSGGTTVSTTALGTIDEWGTVAVEIAEASGGGAATAPYERRPRGLIYR